MTPASEPVPDDPWLAAEQAGTVLPPALPGNLADIAALPASSAPSAAEVLSELRDTDR